MKRLPVLIGIIIIPLALVSTEIRSQEKEIQTIKRIYYQTLPFDTITVNANKMVPGLGEQTSKTQYIYFDCKKIDCELSTVSDRPVLRKVVFDRSVNTSVTHREFLYNQSGELIFQFRRIGSEDYYYETGRECSEERFYLKDGQLILVRVSPCKEYEPFDQIEMTKDFSEDLKKRVNSVLTQSRSHSEIFIKLLQVEE